LLGVKICT